ncbi:MAG: hypothetical protein ABJO36_07465 [Litorimonas sp.]
MRSSINTALVAAILLVGAAPVYAQSADVSPTLLIESGPSDNPEYRRMVFVKYLSGNYVSVNYRAYNRAEFTQVPNTTPNELIAACANGRASTLSEIRAFERAEANRKRRGQSPEIARFCVKNVSNWEGGQRATYLDPIFNGMPHAASLNN